MHSFGSQFLFQNNQKSLENIKKEFVDYRIIALESISPMEETDLINRAFQFHSSHVHQELVKADYWTN